jgi:hypothetical protein
MKKVLLLLLCVLVIASCAGQKNAIKNSTIIEYKAYSRMFYRVISIENQMIYITKSRAEKPVGLRLSNADWNKIKIAIQDLNLESLPNLKAPTEKRLHDGASTAKFKVTINEKEYQTKSFDHGYPPAEIEKIVNKMLSFAK